MIPGAVDHALYKKLVERKRYLENLTIKNSRLQIKLDKIPSEIQEEILKHRRTIRKQNCDNLNRLTSKLHNIEVQHDSDYRALQRYLKNQPSLKIQEAEKRGHFQLLENEMNDTLAKRMLLLTTFNTTIAKNWESRRNFKTTKKQCSEIETVHREALNTMKVELQRLCAEEIKISARADQFEKNVENDKVVMPLVKSVEIAEKKIERLKPLLEKLEMRVLMLKVEKTEAASEVEIRKERMKKLMVSLIEPRERLEVLREKHNNATKFVEYDLSELQTKIDSGEMRFSEMELEIGDLNEKIVSGKIELDKTENHNSRLVKVLEIKQTEIHDFHIKRDLIKDSITKAEKDVQTEKERLKVMNKTWISELEKLENPELNPDLSNLLLDLEKTLKVQQKQLTLEETKDIGLVHYERRKISAEKEIHETDENLSLEIKPVLSKNVKNLEDLKVQFELAKTDRERLTQEQTEAIKIAFGRVELEQLARDHWESVFAEAAEVKNFLRDEVEGNTEFKEVATELRKLRMNEQIQVGLIK